MKKLLVTLSLVSVALAGVLHGNYIQNEWAEDSAMIEAYKDLYPETMPLDPMVDYPFQ